jgi:transcriptional regulator with XRE-family HTH domain|tara:strand:+ start:296 stop:664 length:369 start_codon:yes stop_codon:yes gene_type:complete
MKNSISMLLYKLMKQRQVSQTSLSRATGVPQPTINRILNGVTLYPRHDSMVRLANFFDVTPDSMYGSLLKKAYLSNEAPLDKLCEKIERLSAIDRSTLLLRIANNPLTKKHLPPYPLVTPVI